MNSKMNDAERLKFTQDLISALEFAENASKQTKSPEVLAQEAYNKLQYDFPLVSIEELGALTSKYTSPLGGPQLTNKYIEVLSEGAAPIIAAGNEQQQPIASVATDPLRSAYQKLYAVALLQTLLKALSAPSIEEVVSLLSKLTVPESYQSENSTDWDAIVLPKLTIIAAGLKHPCLDALATWTNLHLCKLIEQCLAAIRTHPHCMQLETVAGGLCALVHDHIIAHSTTELTPALEALVKGLQLENLVNKSESMKEESAMAVRLVLQVAASLASQLSTASTQRQLWKQVNDALLPVSAVLLEWQEGQQRARKRRADSNKQNASEQQQEKKDTQSDEDRDEELKTVKNRDTALVAKLVSFYILRAPPSTDTSDILLKSGVYRSLVLSFVEQGAQPGSEPVHHALRLAGSASPRLVPWAEAVPGFTATLDTAEFQLGGACQLHGAVWKAMRNRHGGGVFSSEDNGGKTTLVKLIDEPLEAEKMPSLHLTLVLLSEVHTAARKDQPWCASTNAALKNLGLRLRQAFMNNDNEPSSGGGAPSITASNATEMDKSSTMVTEIIEEIERANADAEEDRQEALMAAGDRDDQRKLAVTSEQQSEVLLLRQAIKLKAECLRLLKGLLQAPGVSASHIDTMAAMTSAALKAPLVKPFRAVANKNTRVAARVARVECSAQSKKTEALVAAVTVSVAAAMTNPLYAEAATTPSLKNLLNSVLAGGAVLGLIFGAVTAVANFDKIKRT